jgi:hypothetical protein
MQIIIILGILLVLVSLALLKLLMLRRRFWIGACFILILLLGLTLSFIGYLFSPYRIFDENKPVALIESTPAKAEIYDAVLAIKYLTNPKSRRPEKFLLTGNRWIIEGNMLKVKLNKGEINLYRIARIRSGYINPGNLRPFPELAYNLSKRRDILGDFLNKQKLDFIEAFTGTVSYRSGDEKAEFYLYAADSGFRLEKE